MLIHSLYSIQYLRDDQLMVFLGQLGITVGQAGDEFGSSHVGQWLVCRN